MVRIQHFDWLVRALDDVVLGCLNGSVGLRSHGTATIIIYLEKSVNCFDFI